MDTKILDMNTRKNTKWEKRKVAFFVYVRMSVLFVFSYLPASVFGAIATRPPTNLTEFVNNFMGILNYVLPFVAAFGFFGFITGVLKYVNAGGDEERLSQSKQLMVYGLLGMFIMFTFWGIARLLSNSYLTVGI